MLALPHRKYSAVNAERLLGIPRSTIKKHIKRGIPHNVNDGKHRLYDLSECEAYFEAWERRSRKREWQKIGNHDPRPGVIYAMRIVGDKEIRYIGKSGEFKERKRVHLWALNCGDHQNAYLQRWYSKAKREGKEVEIFILQECLPGTMNMVEQEMIARYKAKGHRLCNATDGGDGGWTFSEETKKRLSEISKAKWKDPEYIKRWKANPGGIRISDDERARRDAVKERNRAINDRNMEIAAQRKAEREAKRSRPKNNIIMNDDGTATVELTQGQAAIIDADDVDRIRKYSWHAQFKGRQIRAKRSFNGKAELLTRFIAGVKDDRKVITENGNALDCRKRNLSISRVLTIT